MCWMCRMSARLTLADSGWNMLKMTHMMVKAISAEETSGRVASLLMMVTRMLPAVQGKAKHHYLEQGMPVWGSECCASYLWQIRGLLEL